MDTQEKVIAILVKAATANGLEIIDDRQWGNTGTLRVENPDSVTPLISISYNFQDRYSSFTVKPAHGLGKQDDGELHYVLPEELMDRLVDPLIALMAVITADEEWSPAPLGA